MTKTSFLGSKLKCFINIFLNKYCVTISSILLVASKDFGSWAMLVQLSTRAGCVNILTRPHNCKSKIWWPLVFFLWKPYMIDLCSAHASYKTEAAGQQERLVFWWLSQRCGFGCASPLKQPWQGICFGFCMENLTLKVFAFALLLRLPLYTQNSVQCEQSGHLNLVLAP